MYRQKRENINHINWTAHLFAQDRSLSLAGPTWVTGSYGRSTSAWVLPWFRFPTFLSCGDFEESRYVSGYICIRMDVTSAIHASVHTRVQTFLASYCSMQGGSEGVSHVDTWRKQPAQWPWWEQMWHIRGTARRPMWLSVASRGDIEGAVWARI